VYITAAALIAILLLIVVGIIYRNSVRRKKTNLILEQNNVEILEKSLDLKFALEKNEKQNMQIMQSINYAKNIQKAMVPPKDLLNDFFSDSFIYWKPRDLVSGDFYWFKPIYDNVETDNQRQIFADKDSYNLALTNKLLIAAVDCTGHGVPGAFMSMIGNSLLDEITQRGITTPNIMLKHLKTGINTTLKQHTTKNKDGMDIALCLIDKSKRKLYYSGANNPLILIKNKELSHIKADSISIGGVYQGDDVNFTLHEIDLDDTTYCYIFSDGYVDQFGGQLDRKFMISNFRKFLFEIHDLPFDEQANLLDVAMEGWMEAKNQIDDILVIGFKIDIDQNEQINRENNN